MRCANVKGLFSAWRDGGISDTVKDQLVTHLESCPHCAEAWAGYNEALDALQSDTVEVPDSFRKSWRSRVGVAAAGSLPYKGEGEGKGKSKGNAGSRPGRPARRSVFVGGGLVPKLAAAAALIVVVGLSVVFGNTYLSRPSAENNDGVYESNMMLEEDQVGGMMTKDSARGLASAPEPQISAMSGDSGANANRFSAKSQVNSQQRKIIRTAQITIETSSVEETCNRIEMLAASFGGYVQSSILRNADAENPDSKEQLSGSVQIAVPSEMFDQILAQLPDLGKVLHKNVSGQDVTEEYVDLEARLKNWRSQEDQLNLIMTKARNVEEILAVQNELARVREEIERLTGRLQYLQRRTDFADFYFTVVAPGNEQDDSSPSPFIEALRQIGRQLWDSVAGLLSFIVTLAPWIAFAVVIFLAGRSWWRKRDL